MRQLRTMIKMAALVGYLLTVTAALPLHRCDTHRSEAVGAAASGGCAHCEHGCPTRSAAADDGSSQHSVSEAGHRSEDCFVCQVLTQKSLATVVAVALDWDESVAEPPLAAPSPPTLSLRFSWLIRAPPRIA